MRCSGAGVRLPPWFRRIASEMLAFQRQRVVKSGASSTACTSTSSTDALLRKRATLSSSKLCVSPSDSTIASSVAAACSSKLNARQKRLRRASPKARLIRAPSGAWMTSCIPPDSSKKRSNTSVASRRQTAQHGLGGCEIFDELLRRHTIDAETLHGVVDGSSDSLAGHLGQQRLDGFPQPRHCRGELGCAGRRLAEPERDTGRLTLGVFDPDTARLDAQDAVRGVTKLEDVALEALDREILVERSDERPGRLEDHLVVRVVGDGAATGDGGQPGATPRPQPVVHRITVQIGAASPAPCADALGEHPHHVIEVLARQLPVRPCAGDEGEELLLAIFARRHLGHDLLRQHVERVRRDAQLIELLAAHRIEQRDRFDQLVAARREQPALRHAADRVIGTTHPLQEHGDGARRPQLTDELHVANVDTELERGRCDHRLEPARLETLLRVEALLLGETAMVSRDVLLADALGEMPRHPLHHAPRIREYERGVMLRTRLASWS